MAVQDFYQNRRDLGPSAVVEYLNAWLGERSSMNKRLMAQEDVDPAKLAEQESRIRRAIADLVKIKESGSQAERRDAGKLAQIALKSVGDVTGKNATASATRGAALIRAQEGLARTTVMSRKRIADALEIDDDRVQKIIDSTHDEVSGGGESAADQVTRPNGRPGKLGQRVDDLIDMVKGDPSKRDAVVSQVIAQYEAAGDEATVRALTEKYANGEASWDAYMMKRYPDFTPEEHKAVLDEMKRVTAGASTKPIMDLYKELAGNDTDTESSSSTESAGPVPSGIDDQIAELEKAADDLAEQRRNAGRKNLFPRPNYMIANPNTYTDPRQLRELRSWGTMDAPYVAEVSDSLARTGSFRKAQEEIEGRGGISPAVEQIDAELLTDDDYDPSAEVAERWRQVAGGRVAGEGGWVYEMNADGTISTETPDGKRGLTVKPGSKEHVAIVNEVFNPGAMPDSVAALYGPALTLARAGKWADAATEADAVDPADVRSSYADALRRMLRGETAISRVPPERQIEVLAESMGGKPGTHMRALLRQPMGDRYATGRIAGALGSLADAMDAAPAIERKRRERDRAEAATGLAPLRAGREIVSPDYAAGRTKAEGMLAKIKAADPDPERIRAKVTALTAALDPTAGEMERGMVEALKSAATPMPTPMRSLPATSADVAARPSAGAPLQLGRTSTPGTAKGADISRAAADPSAINPLPDDPEAADFDAFLTSATATRPEPDPDADFDSFLAGQPKEK